MGGRNCDVEDLVDHPDVRVLLVGRTGLDAALRLDPGVELVRVRTALEAIGELSDPIDERSPARSVVIVGQDADPGASSNGHGDGRAEFLRAARIVDPGVRVFLARAERSHSSKPGEAVFDGVIDPGDGATRISTLIRGGDWPGAVVATGSPTTDHSAHPAVPVASPPPIVRPSPVPAAFEPQQESHDSTGVAPGDASLARVLLRGGDLVMPAVHLIRARTTDDSVQFVRKGQPLPTGPTPVPVECEEAAYGHLWSDRTLPEELLLHAQWLALWLRLGEQQAQLRDAAFTDPLTGAWNRRYFDRYLKAAIQGARVTRQPVTVMCFDIDDFKRFNDAYGHQAADEILVETVRLLRSVIRPSDRVCRVGGDEFAVIFHEPHGPRRPGSAPPASVFDIARRFQEQICDRRFPKLGVEAPGTLTVSGGLATFPWDGSTPEELIRRADMLALESKRAGKNAIVFGPGQEPRRVPTP